MTPAARQAVARALPAMVGLFLVGCLVRNAGPSRVVQVLSQAAWRLPLVFTLEFVQLASDVVALRWLLETASGRVPVTTWVRSSAAAYAMMILVPAGRAAGEVTRATLLARHVGAPWATTAAAQLQAAYLFANGVLSLFSCIAVTSWLGARSFLSLALVANTVLMWALSAGVLAVLRGDRAGRWIERMRLRLVKGVAAAAPLEAHARRRLPWRAAVMCSASRGAQVVQYGVLLAAVGGVSTVQKALIAHGIHLVGSTVGDVLPNQLGIVDGAYSSFAAAIGFAGQPARALAIPFLAHTVQLTCAAGCIVVAALIRRAAALHDAGQAAGPASDPS